MIAICADRYLTTQYRVGSDQIKTISSSSPSPSPSLSSSSTSIHSWYSSWPSRPALVYFLQPVHFLQRECKILASYIGQLWLFCCQFMRFLVYFYRLKNFDGVPKLTNIRYDGLLYMSSYMIVSCPTRQSLLLFMGSLHRFPYPDNKEI